jgi:signal peptidase I
VELLGSSGRQAVIPVEGGSMVPTFPPETVILVDFSARSPVVGDIILFHQAGSLVVHRFLARVDSRNFGPCMRTRGDSIQALDPPLLDKDLLGRVIAYRRSGTWYRLEGAGARLWAAMVGAHDYFWAVVAVGAGRMDGVLSRIGLGRRLKPAAGYLDQIGLRLGDRILFHLLHRTMDPPTLQEAELKAQGQSRR